VFGDVYTLLMSNYISQVAMQLAFYRDQGHPCATYESASTRMFQLGRTDTIRSCTPKSLEFCQAMSSGSLDRYSMVYLFIYSFT